jgi:hypothetical protein
MRRAVPFSRNHRPALSVHADGYPYERESHGHEHPKLLRMQRLRGDYAAKNMTAKRGRRVAFI